ncbi:uncharacterized protein LOC129740353 [Uranotaenia lowii]|uniref:uncharacterized protein LOC129740353 n=1 Tax=Uranotaenia lowii TaxID=190385 RepID=UPI00247A928E|nr:uncharacterized protein LOC129740353 [Uranotaenia lowii]XP_055587994.1 uncharacterized protein LOC129740353 [Uranotaenia lowii]XP_055588001.1 uncharacterized protein LOC129740353 [Uranotaenia lowii]
MPTSSEDDFNTTDLENTFSCRACEKPDSAENLVACDKCDDWLHFSCAGVGPEVKNLPWLCDKCSPPVTKAVSVRSTTSVRKAKLELELKRLEEQEQIAQKFLEKKYRKIEESLQEDEEDRRSEKARREVSAKEKNLRTTEWVISQPGSELEGAAGRPNPSSTGGMGQSEAPNAGKGENEKLSEPMLCSLQKQLQSCQGAACPTAEQLQELQDMLKLCQLELAGQKSSLPLSRDPLQESIGQWKPTEPEGLLSRQPSVPPQPQPSLAVSFAKGAIPKTNTHRPKSNRRSEKTMPRIPEYEPESFSRKSRYQEHQIDETCLVNLQPHAIEVDQPKNDYATHQLVNTTPTKQQMAARKTFGGNLPSFSGNPLDWPVFISHFTFTSEACGFNNGENMLRLQRCLTGAAWESVRSRLILPTSVPSVIETLRERFGKPEVIIESLIERVKNTAPPRADRLASFIDFGTMVQALCDHIEAADLKDHMSNPTLLKYLIGKLPDDYKMQWARFRRVSNTIDLRTFASFMNEIVADAVSVTPYPKDFPVRHAKLRPDRNYFHSITGGSHSGEEAEFDEVPLLVSNIECAVCRKEGHRSKDCREFLSLTIDERWDRINSLNLCRACLYSHGRRTCRNKNRCGTNGCDMRHHPLLHRILKPKAGTSSNEVASVVHQFHESFTPSLLYRIIPVMVHKGKISIHTYAFIDEGSSLTMLETELANKLGLKGSKRPLCLKWTGDVTRTEYDSQRVSFEISEREGTKRYVLENVGTVKSLNLPDQTLSINKLKERFDHLRGLPIIDYQNASPQLLIGVDNLSLVVPLKAREGVSGGPIAVRTRLGWCVYGGKADKKTMTGNYHICDCGSDTRMDDALKGYFESEEVGTKTIKLEPSSMDQRAMQLLKDATVFVGDRYESALLWKYDHIELPDSYPMAVSRLRCLERKMEKDPALKANVTRQILEYQQKGFCHRATRAELEVADPRRTWYLPLGAVTNPKKPGKVRLIWDAAAEVNKVSLNSVLLKGPDQLTPLPSVLFRFRQFPIAVCADIREMYHQIRIREVDRNSQRFLWRDHPGQDPEIFLMDVATFGASCSPATAQFVKNTNALRFKQQYPEAVKEIIDGHYVDDCATSFRCIEEAKITSWQIKYIHKCGGFDLRNFCSNSREVLHYLGEKEAGTVKNLIPENDDAPERVLGLLWDTMQDKLRFPTTMRKDIANLIEQGLKPTKREVLRCVMSLFDPLGLLAPYLIFGKILMQEIWRKGLGWDEQIDDDSFELWCKWTKILENINDIGVPRCYFSMAVQEVEIHTFTDASEAAYSCATYFRFVKSTGTTEVTLVGAKTKVAPLKPWSIPRLELQGCVLGARFTRFIEEGHSLKTIRRIMWSDSTTALSWINADPRKFHRFVAFRVAEILELSHKTEWRWVPTKQNPADEATKWGTGPSVNSNSIWFTGPKFLLETEDKWPVRKSTSTTDEELRACHVQYEILLPESQLEIGRFSKWNRLLRTTAYTHRFISVMCPSVGSHSSGGLSSKELKQAETTLFKQAQWEDYPDEMVFFRKKRHSPKDHKYLNKSSKLYQLTPTLDEQGVLRLDGRIGRTPRVALDLKYPIMCIAPNRIATAGLATLFY